jgi:hypothetical protein
MRRNLIYLVFVTIFIQSCSSLIYSPQNRRDNNSFEINSNYSNYSIRYSKSKNLSPTKIGTNKFRIEKLKGKNTYITLSSPSSEDLNLKISRSPRTGILLLDLPSIFLLGIPLAVDIASADFYRISPQSKIINVNFQRNNEYFKSKIRAAYSDLNEKILDEISTENPKPEILNLIESTRNEIVNGKLLNDFNKIKNSESNKFEFYLSLKSKYNNKSFSVIKTLDSLNIIVQLFEINNIRKTNDLIRLVKLTRIADKEFSTILKTLKPEIEKNVYKKIIENYDFNLITELLNTDSENRNTLLNVKKDTEAQLINEVSQTNNLSLIEKYSSKVEETSKVKLEDLRKKIVENNKRNKLKIDIEAINKLVSENKFKDALDKIDKIYPNTFSEDSDENITIKKIKKNAAYSYENQKNVENLQVIDDKIKNGEFPFQEINDLLSNSNLGLPQKNNLLGIKKNLEIKYQKAKQLEAIEQARIEKQRKIDESRRIKEEQKAKAEASKVYRLGEAQVCDNLIAYKDRSVVISGFYSSSQSENQGWSLRSRNDFNEEQLNSSMTFQFYEENESFYTRVIFVGDCPIILRIPRGLSSVPNINGNYITVQGVVIGRNKIKVSSLSR